jgi:hypothetical protein
MIAEAFSVENALVNETNKNRKFVYVTPVAHGSIYSKLCNPTLGKLFEVSVSKYFI